MDASKYPVSFPFGATTAPYSPSNPHNGDDRVMPLKTSVVVNGMPIGYSGNTGKSTGPHLHVSRYLNGRYVRPGNPFALPGAVVFDTGYSAASGYFVRIRAADGSTYAYCHLSPNIPLRPGQAVIAAAAGRGGGENQEPMIQNTDNEYGRWNKLFTQIRGREASRQEFINAAVGRPWLKAMEILSDSGEADQATADQATGAVARRDNWPAQIKAGQDLAKALDGQVKELQILAGNLKADDDRDKQLITTQINKISALTEELQAAHSKAKAVVVSKASVSTPSIPLWLKPLVALAVAASKKK